MKKAVLVLLYGFALWAQAKPEKQTQALNVQRPASSARKIEVLDLAPAIVTQHERIQRLIGPKTKQMISRIAPAFSARVRQLPPTADFHGLAVAEVRGAFQGFGNLSNGDIEALAFLVMMQAVKDAQSDLKNIIGRDKESESRKAEPARRSESEGLHERNE